MSTPTTDALVRVYIKIRAARSTLKKAYDEEDGDLQVKQKKIEVELLRRAQEQGVEGFKTEDGTTYRATDTHAKIADPDAFRTFVLSTGDLDFYEQRPSLKHIKEFSDEHEGKVPPGVHLFREERMRVRTASKRQPLEGNGDE